MVLLHALELLLGEFGHAGLLELLQPAPDGLVTHEDRFADVGGRATHVVNFGCDENSGSAQAGRTSPLAHPVPLHALDEFDGGVDDILGLAGEV